MAHVFISYIREDQEYVDHLCNMLKSAGIEVWLDRESIQPGTHWSLAIENAIRDGAFFIACFSNAYYKRQNTYMNEELTRAFLELTENPKERTWFIPLLLDDCQIPDLRINSDRSLRDIQWISMGDDWNQGVNKLVSLILRQTLNDSNQSDADMRELARLWRRTEQLIDQLSSLTSSVEDRRFAAEALQKLTPHTQSALPALQQALHDDDDTVRINAIRALVAMGPESAPALVKAIANPDKRVHNLALDRLMEFGPVAASVIPDLMDALSFENGQKNKLTVADVLASIGESVIPVLIEAISSQNPKLIQSAADAMSKMVPVIKNVAPTIEGWLENEDKNVRVAATKIMRHIIEEVEGFDAEKAVVPLAEALREIDTRHDAFYALYKIGEKAVSAIPVLIEILREPEDSFRNYPNNHDVAQKVLFYIGTPAIPALTTLIDDKEKPDDPEQSYIKLMARYHALESLGMILYKTEKPALPQVLYELTGNQGEDKWLRCKAAIILAHKGVRTNTILEILIESTKNIGWDFLSWGAISALGEFENKADKVIPHLIPILLESPQLDRRASAAEAFAKLGQEAAPALETLIKAIDDESPLVIAPIVEALGKLGQQAKSAIPKLEKLLNAGSSDVQNAASVAITKITQSCT